MADRIAETHAAADELLSAFADAGLLVSLVEPERFAGRYSGRVRALMTADVALELARRLQRASAGTDAAA